MKLTILGSGTCVPSLKRSAPANLLQIKNKNILIDCGSGTLTQLIKAKSNYKNIDIIFLTHFHTDHISELNAFIQALNWTPGFIRKKGLTIIGPNGLKKLYKNNFFRIKTGLHKYKIKIQEIKNKIKFDGFTVEYQKTNHTNESVAYKFIEKNKSLIISGDTDYNENLINFSKNSDVLLLECSYLNKKVFGHLTAKGCGQIAKKANVKKLILTHLYPPAFHDKKKLIQAKKIFKNTILAEDLMRIEI